MVLKNTAVKRFCATLKLYPDLLAKVKKRGKVKCVFDEDQEEEKS